MMNERYEGNKIQNSDNQIQSKEKPKGNKKLKISEKVHLIIRTHRMIKEMKKKNEELFSNLFMLNSL